MSAQEYLRALGDAVELIERFNGGAPTAEQVAAAVYWVNDLRADTAEIDYSVTDRRRAWAALCILAHAATHPAEAATP